MGVSSKCIDLVKAFEGCRLEAYECPAKIPTIGYGTTFYPNGQAVRMGDRISQQQAEAYLAIKCDSLYGEIQKLVKVPLNQNQIDALVSFVYNIGLGAFQRSTLLKFLNQGDYAAAANEFPEWNKATVNGVKQVLNGLVRRRDEERFLFKSSEGMAEPIAVAPSVEETVTWLELYRDANGQNLVAAWNGETLVELLELNRALKEDLAVALQQYPSAKNVHVAPADKPIPAGERISLEASAADIAPPLNAPPLNAPPDLNGQMLCQGSEGSTVTWLQERLFDLGYYQGNLDGEFGVGTDAAVRNFQAAVLGSSEADGKVGPITWKALQGNPPQYDPKTAQPGDGTYLRLTKTNAKDEFGCYKLRLAYIKNGQEIDHLMTCSGQARVQNFRTGPESASGSYEPLPEGQWHIHNIQWAGGRDNYGAHWRSGIGAIKILLTYEGPKFTRRTEIMIHRDKNRPPHGNAPGTAGCIGLYTIADCKRLVQWLRDTDPRDLYVDWGLGTCPKPAAMAQFATA
ncbi:MAG: glycoside hydrolase family protein [Leptolyngbya sp. RL_3_1]|nr:glycoside hydrolase family protein [Leptolyngbya sp. RL_3_1]